MAVEATIQILYDEELFGLFDNPDEIIFKKTI